MTVATSTVPNLPDVNVVRIVKANDAGRPTEAKFGISCADYEEILVNVVLKNGATGATVKGWTWSPEAAAFVEISVGASYTGGAASVRFRVNRARSLFLEVTAIAGGAPANDRVFLEVGGLPAYDEVG